MRRNLVGMIGLGLLSASVVGGSTYAYYQLFPPGRTLPGAYVGGRLQPTDQPLGQWLEERRVALREREVYLRRGELSVPVTLGELGVDLDVAATMHEARKHAEDGDLGARIHRALRARDGDEDVELVWMVDRNRGASKLAELAPLVHRDPVDAKLDLKERLRIDDKPGIDLDVERTLDAIEAAPRDEWSLVDLEVREVPARITSKTLANIDVSKVLGAFETNYKGTGRGREVNIKRGAELLNGIIISPGQTISFNEIVGPRTRDRGFTWAPVIIDDELTPGIGGGTCQVASTLYAAAVYGNFEVVDRRSHSRPSGYTPLGLDATVIYGEVDLKLRNPYDTPVIISAFVPKPGKLRVEILGAEGPKVEYKYGVAKVHPTYRRVKTKRWMQARRIRKQRGKKGYDVFSTVTVTHADGRVAKRTYFSGYRPVPEVYWVGPEHDIEELPEPGDGMTRVEVDGKKLPPELFAENPYTTPSDGADGASGS